MTYWGLLATTDSRPNCLSLNIQFIQSQATPLITIVSLLYFSIQYLCAKSDCFLALGLGPCWLLSWCWLRRDPHNCSSFGVLKCRSGTDVSSFLAICWIRVVQSLVFSAVICRSLFVFLSRFICIVCPLVYGF